jgi:KDO2-lipid IV(A) lauroyltransferase
MKKKGKKRPLVGLLFRAVIRLLSIFPLRWTHRLGVVVGWCLWLVPNPLKKISTANISRAYPGYLPEQHNRLLRHSLIELGKGFCELGPLWYWPREKLLSLTQDQGGSVLLKEALTQGRGVIVLSPHLGAWELMGLYCSIFFPITSLYRPPRVSSMADFMRQVREREGAILVPTDVSGIKALFRALKNNEMVGILPDQDPGKRGGVLAPFFNYPANTMTLLAKLIKKTGAPVLFTFAERLPKGAGFKVHVIEAGEGLDAANELEAATALNQQIEQCVNLVPAQYLWSYGRYRKVKKYLRRQQKQ